MRQRDNRILINVGEILRVPSSNDKDQGYEVDAI